MQNRSKTDKSGDFKSLQSFIEQPPGCPQWSRARRVHIERERERERGLFQWCCVDLSQTGYRSFKNSLLTIEATTAVATQTNLIC